MKFCRVKSSFVQVYHPIMVCDNIICFLDFTLQISSLIILPFYITLLYTLIKFRNQLNSSFFTLFISTGIADCCFLILQQLFLSIPKLYFPEMREEPILSMGYKVTTWSLYFTQVFGILLIAVNRYLGLTNPMKYEQVGIKLCFTK